MSHRRRGHRASRRQDAEGKPLIRPVPQGTPKRQRMQVLIAYDPRQPETTYRRMLRGAKGAIKWVDGMPTVHYHRDGYFWHQGRYIKGTQGTGLTSVHSQPNRAERRAQHSAVAKAPKGVRRHKGYTPPQGDRGARKQMARQAFEESRRG
jgi:hypothetical protein